MLNLDHTRHSGIFNAKDTSVVLIGAGGIGAITAITLAKMGVGWLEVWDADNIDGVNIATQYHLSTLLGANKALALSTMIDDLAPGTSYHPRPVNIEPGDVVRATVVISALDSIDTRKMVWHKVLFHEQSRWEWY